MAKYRQTLSRVQRQFAIRTCGANRIVSLDAVLVIRGLIPIERLAKERISEYRNENKITSEEEHLKTL